MNKKEKKLIGALIGLAKACNVHLKTENTDGIIIKSLASIFPLEENGEELLQRVREEKLAVAPDCATCFAPCGNTDEYNLDELQASGISETVRDLKFQLLNVSHEIKSVYLIATRDLSNLWLQFFLSQNQGFMRLFEKTVLK